MKSRVRASVVVVQNGQLLTFRAVDPSSGKEYYFLPGGKIEDDETAPEAAERECYEETGFEVEVDASSNIDREYHFFWDGQWYDCLTIFYRAHVIRPALKTVQDADYNKGAVWIPVAEISRYFDYSQEILAAVDDLL